MDIDKLNNILDNLDKIDKIDKVDKIDTINESVNIKDSDLNINDVQQEDNIKIKTIKKSKLSKLCTICNKKTSFNLVCKCGNNYCDNHRYPFTHNCSYDEQDKQNHKKFLEKNNPIIIANKVDKI